MLQKRNSFGQIAQSFVTHKEKKLIEKVLILRMVSYGLKLVLSGFS